MARFFIDRPVFAWVIALMALLTGIISLRGLPIAQYPNIAPPMLAITVNYPGASAKTLEETVTAVIEQEMTGIENMIYMSSASSASGNVQINLTFASGSNLDVASMEVQNRIKRIEARLPEEVRRQGVRVDKSRRNYMMFLTLSSPNESYDDVALGDFATNRVIDFIRSVPGVGEANILGTEYAMRIWIEPLRLGRYGLTMSDVVKAVREQNVQVATGELGAVPSAKGQMLNATIVTESRLNTPEQFENILLRVNADGSTVKLKDVGNVELGGASYAISARVNGKPAAAIGIKLAPTGNALATSDAVHAKMEELAKFFPAGIVYTIPYDTSKFVRISIEEVVKTLLEAILLVFLVMYLFLQNWRVTLIPTLVVPVALMGAFTGMAVFGYSINVLTMFGLVLAIGILVDDAIVVVENVERIMAEEGLSPHEATRKAMMQISGAIIGITLVLVAVFIPMAFFGGSVGAIYRQFSLSLVVTILFSAMLALSLTPALCSTLLRHDPHAGHQRKGFFGWFNRGFTKSTNSYTRGVSAMIKRSGRFLIIYIGIIAAVVWLMARLPTAFLPDEDQGYLINITQLPPGATQERTLKVLEEVEGYYLTQEKSVAATVSVAGFSFFGNGQNAGITFVALKPWDERKTPDLHVLAVIKRAFGRFAAVKDAIIFPLNPPPIPELGTATGFEFQLQDRGYQGHDALLAARNQMLGMAAKNPALIGVRPEGLEDTAQMIVEIDRAKARALGVAISDINDTLSIALGSAYANDFVRLGRVQKVIIQAAPNARMMPQDVLDLWVKNQTGQMLPLSTFTQVSWGVGSPRLERFNGVPSMKIAGQAAPGHSSGEAMAAMEAMAAQLPPGFSFEWSGQSYEERLSGSQAPALFMLSLVVVFLCLAALYESWSIPASVLLVVPLGVLGALAAVYIRGMPNDVYFKVGLIAIIGLSAKNAILIVEFAKDLHATGKDLSTAILEACRLRFRPILMTSMAFTFGVLPLAVSTGAGAASRQAIGTGVMGGMIAATVLAVLFVPVFFVVIRKIFPPNKHELEFNQEHARAFEKTHAEVKTPTDLNQS